MRRIALIVALAAIAALSCSGARAQDLITDTVDPLAPYMHELERVYTVGIIHGFEDDTFRPDDITRRGELFVALNRLIDVARTRGLELPNDYAPDLATYGRGVRDHWAMEAWERLVLTTLADRRPVPLVLDFEAEIKRIEFAEYAVAIMRAYGAAPAHLTPAEIALDEGIMVVQDDGAVHFQGAMPRWELAVGLSRLLDRLAPKG